MIHDLPRMKMGLHISSPSAGACSENKRWEAKTCFHSGHIIYSYFSQILKNSKATNSSRFNLCHFSTTFFLRKIIIPKCGLFQSWFSSHWFSPSRDNASFNSFKTWCARYLANNSEISLQLRGNITVIIAIRLPQSK